MTDQALQYAYSFDYRLPEKGVENSVSKSIEVPDSIVYRVMPLEKQKLLVRLENLADKFDGSESAHFDLEKLAKELFAQANPGKNATAKITEMAIDGVQTKAELLGSLSKEDPWLSEDG